ncbi:hypothetical protein ACET3X_004094 [Alternaria dauci]|uniref:Uncharacterized protein n=1 Tax=Alternaria dauci TaxID=48095 RepID=A0ABR3UN63_9PLEO
MLISTQALNSDTSFARIQPPNSKYDRVQSDSRGWEHPRGRRVKKVKEAENKKQGGKWGRSLKKNTSLGDTNVVDMASRSMQGSGSSLTPVVDTSSRTTRPRAATQLQHPEFARSGLRARSLSPKAPILVTGSFSPLAPESQQLEHTFITIQKSDAVGTLQPRFDLPNSKGRYHVRRDNREVLLLNPVRSPYKDGLNIYHGSDNPDAATLKWLEETRAPAGLIAKPVVNMRGGDVTSMTGEASSLASHYCSLTSAATSLNSSNEIIDSSDVDALLVPSTHLNIVEAINVDDTRPGLDEANVRSSFSTDSTIELRRKKKAEKNIWRNEDQARAMAMAMHSIS